MELFLVIWLHGKIAATAGPLPYDMAECMRRAEIMRHEYEVKAEEEYPGFEFGCVEADERPALEYDQ